MISKKRIMVVDDEQPILDLVRSILEDRYDVLTIDNPEAMFRQIGVYYPDLLLMDVILPGVDGDAILAQLREEGVKIPIILFSATYNAENQADVSHWVEMLEGQAAIAKPFDVVDLVATVDRLINAGPISLPD